MLRADSRIRLIAVLVVFFLSFGVVMAGAAQAADEISTESSLNADQLKRLKGLPEDQRTAIRDRLAVDMGKSLCSNPLVFGPMGGNECQNVAAKAYASFLSTPEQALDYNKDNDAGRFCTALSGTGAPSSAVASCIAQKVFEKYAPLVGLGVRAALTVMPGGQFVLGTVDVVAFIANAKDGFEKFANTVKAEGVKATNEVMNNMLKTSAFEVNDSFRDTWAAYAGIGIVILALMYFKLWKDVSDEEIDMDTARQSLVWYGPLSMLLVLFGPAIGYQLNAWFSALTAAVTPWTSGHIAAFAEAISRFASYQSTGVFGPLAGVVLFGMLFAGAWALLGLFALHPFALYMIGLGLAMLLGFLIHPKYRERVGKTGTLWISIAVSKPLLLVLMGGVFSFIVSRPAFSGEGVDDAMVNASSVFLAAAAMLVLAFSPAALFKLVPLLPASSTRLGAGRESVAGSALVAGAGAGIASAIRQRRIDQSRSTPQPGRQRPGTGQAGTLQDGTADNSTARDGSAQNSRVQNSRAGQGRQSTAGESRAGGSAVQESGSRRDRREPTIGELQRQDRANSKSARAGKALASGAGSVARGTGKVAAGGATAFLLAGREAARQASFRGRRSAHSFTPDTDHISGH